MVKRRDKCIMPEMPYCPCCQYGSEYREPWWEDDDVEWICSLGCFNSKRQERIIEERNKYY